MSYASDMRRALVRSMTTPAARIEFITRLMGSEPVRVGCGECGESHWCPGVPAIITPEEARALLDEPFPDVAEINPHGERFD